MMNLSRRTLFATAAAAAALPVTAFAATKPLSVNAIRVVAHMAGYGSTFYAGLASGGDELDCTTLHSAGYFTAMSQPHLYKITPKGRFEGHMHRLGTDAAHLRHYISERLKALSGEPSTTEDRAENLAICAAPMRRERDKYRPGIASMHDSGLIRPEVVARIDGVEPLYGWRLTDVGRAVLQDRDRLGRA